LRSKINDLRLIKESTTNVILAKMQKKNETEKKRIDDNFMKMWRIKRDKMHIKDVAARKDEKNRMKNFIKSSLTLVLDELLQFLSNSKTI
jgi:hypothetical protein